MAGAPLLIAHRGGARLAPENTLETFRDAVDVWAADILEMDVRATADGRIVVLHDPDVDRTTDGTGAVADLTLDEVRELDAGYGFRDPEGRASHLGRGIRIPLLEEVLESFPRVRLNVEIKSADAAMGTVEIVRRHDATHRVLIAAERERWRRGARSYRGPWGASRGQLISFWLLHRTPIAAVFTPAADALQVPVRWKGRPVITPRFVREAHLRNLPVHVWTVDEPEEMRRLLAMGVDGIQSDRPDLLAAVLTDEAGRPPPPGRPDPHRRDPPEASGSPEPRVPPTAPGGERG